MRSEEKWNEKKLLSKSKHLIRLAGLVSWSQNQLLYQTRMSNLGSEARVRLSRSEWNGWNGVCSWLWSQELRSWFHRAITKCAYRDFTFLTAHSLQWLYQFYHARMCASAVPVSFLMVWPTILALLKTYPWILPRPTRISLNPSGSHHPIVPTIRPEWHLSGETRNGWKFVLTLFHFHLSGACKANLNQGAILPSTAADRKLSRPVPRAEDLGPWSKEKHSSDGSKD